MGEHHNNINSVVKEELGLGKNADKSVSPMTGENLLIITELARIGHTYLKQAVQDIAANLEKGDSAITKEQYEHFKSLYEVGFDTLAHFDAMCQYLHEQTLAKSGEEQKEDAPAEHKSGAHDEQKEESSAPEAQDFVVNY